jgi:hypothetical protein
MSRFKAKTSPTGYVAGIEVGGDLIEFPVVRFDDEGYALYCTTYGQLTRADAWPGFKYVCPIGVAA